MSDKKFIQTSSSLLSDEDTLTELEAGEGNGESYLVTISGEDEPKYFIKASTNQDIQQFEVTVKEMLNQYDIPLPETVETNFEGDNIFVISEAIPKRVF